MVHVSHCEGAQGQVAEPDGGQVCAVSRTVNLELRVKSSIHSKFKVCIRVFRNNLLKGVGKKYEVCTIRDSCIMFRSLNNAFYMYLSIAEVVIRSGNWREAS